MEAEKLMNVRRQVEIVAARTLLKGIALRVRPYQPVTIGGHQIAAARRPCVARAESTLNELSAADVETAVDHGCAEGYFVRRCAEQGIMSIEVETDGPRLLLAQVSLTVDRVEGFGFIRQHIEQDNVDRLPSADATLSLSLMHHFMAKYGVDYARAMLTRIREKTRKVLIFEMGQADEPHFTRNAELPDMGTEPHSWIAEFIESAGFRDPSIICRTPALGSEDIDRATFSANV